MGRWLGALFVSGGVAGLVCLALPHWHGLHVAVCLVDGLIAVVAGLGLLARGDRLPARVCPWLALGGIVVITVATYGTGAQGAPTASLLYALAGLYVGAMFAPAVILAELGAIAAGYGITLAIVGGRGAPAEWVATLVVTAVIAGVTAGMTRANRRLALHDALTALPNRRALDESLDILLAAARRREFPLSVAILDLDEFKAVNAELGHQGADDLLVGMVRRWQSLVRPEDLLARYGGDEFVLLLPDASLPVATRIVERLAASGVPGGAFSAGVATWDGEEDSAHLLRRADAALYEAKDLGRGRVIAARSDPLAS